MQIEPDLMFERKDSHIRFHHTDAISSAQWGDSYIISLITWDMVCRMWTL